MSSTHRRRLAAVAVSSLVATQGLRATAAPEDPQVAAARDLFVRAEKDEDAGRWDDALEKLRRVLETKVTAGVLYHVALCEEHLGRLASALQDYKAAELHGQAESARDVLRLVGPKQADLGPRVPRLTIRLVPDVAGASVAIDGSELAPGALDGPIPLDPGTHQVEASAPGRPPATASVTVQEHDVTVLDLRVPEAPPPSPPASSAAPSGAPPEQPAGPRRDRTWAVVETAGAVVLAAAGVGAYLAAGSAHDDAVASCARRVAPQPDACDSDRGAVRRWDWVAAGTWVGAAGVGALAVLSWTRPSVAGQPPPASARLVVRGGSVALAGSF
jgi:hypothetical protein